MSDDIRKRGLTLQERLDEVVAHRTIASAIIEGKRHMALKDKLAHLAERNRDVTKRLDERADSLLARLAAVEDRGEQAFTNMERLADQHEQGIAATEDALNQLTNGAPFE